MYARYVQWAERCNISLEEFQNHLATAHSLPLRRRGVLGLPKWIQVHHATVRQHAVLLCRVAGLRAAAARVQEELGADWKVDSVKEMDRILALTEVEVQLECGSIPARLRAQQGFHVDDKTHRGNSWEHQLVDVDYRSGTWVLSLFRVWLYREGARLMKVEDTWCDLIGEKPLEQITAPIVSRSMTFPRAWASQTVSTCIRCRLTEPPFEARGGKRHGLPLVRK